ncbi:MAG: hypothetical protein MUC63_02770 [Planctomycetes bacterium]|jgi:hypothetical protein|nr:hypothetical protein [Planctomycetota bacterium]
MTVIPRLLVPVLLSGFLSAAFAEEDFGPATAAGVSRPSAAVRILVIGAEAPPPPEPFRVAALLDYRQALGPGLSAPGGAGSAELSFPLGPVRIAAFASGGAWSRERTWTEDRPFTATVSGETVTFVRRVEVTEREAVPAASAGLLLSVEVGLGGGLALRLGAGPAAGSPSGSWGPGGRAFLSLEIGAGRASFSIRVSGEAFRAPSWEGAIAAGIGAGLSF